MDFGDAINTELPAPRDDEPIGLRRDILDELADHLACSYNRELLRGAGPSEARRRAIERFGDPAAVARRLWLDAMKGKIMAQRVLIATCLVVMAACLGIAGLVGIQSNRAAAEVAEANRRLAEVLGQTEATNQEMLRQLQAMAKPASAAKSADWIPVKFRLTIERPDGPPAVGLEVVIGRGHGGTGKEGAIHRIADADGVADFGVVQPGDWEFQLKAGWWMTGGSLNVVPGTAVAREIICPKVPPEPSQVRVRVDWPAPLADKDLRAFAVFGSPGITYQPPLRWATDQTLRILCGPHGAGFIPEQSIGFASRDLMTWNEANDPSHVAGLMARGRIWAGLADDPSISETEPLEIGAGHYTLKTLALMRPVAEPPSSDGPPPLQPRPVTDPSSSGGRIQLQLLSLMSRDGQGLMVTVPSRAPGGARTQSFVFVHGIRIRPSTLGRFDHYEARPGQTAEWVISPPEEMIREVEKRLKADAPEKVEGKRAG